MMVKGRDVISLGGHTQLSVRSTEYQLYSFDRDCGLYLGKQLGEIAVSLGCEYVSLVYAIALCVLFDQNPE